MMTFECPNRDELFTWVVRSSEPDFDGWEALAAWLNGDPARNRAYDRAMAANATAAELLVAARVSDKVVAFHGRGSMADTGRRWWVVSGLAMAASVAGALLLYRPADVPEAWKIDTAVGRGRTITLADGSHIDLAGGSRLVLDRARSRRATIMHGRALFTVRHNDADAFQVTAGNHQIVDAGTAFEVTRDAAGLVVEVAEGRVVVDPERSALHMMPGDSARWRPGGGPAEVSRVPTSAIGQWRNGRISYHDMPLSRVGADLSAALGLPVTVDPAIAQRRFTGTLVPATLRGQPGDVAALLRIRIRGNDTGWEFLP